MSIDTSGIAFAIRSESAQSTHPIKLGHAHQCVAAALGYASLAGLQSSGDDALPLGRETHILLDVRRLAQRRVQLGLTVEDDKLLALVRECFEKRHVGISVHESKQAFEHALSHQVDDTVLNDSAVSGEIGRSNTGGLREIYLPFALNLDAVPDDGERLELAVDGHVAMEVDDERPYFGHRVNVKACVWLSRPGKAIWACTCQVRAASLDLSAFEADEREPAQVSLTEALAQELGLSFDEADLLVDAQVDELTDSQGMVIGHSFDFSELELSAPLHRKLARKAADLRLVVSAHFFDRLHGGQDKPERHYVHGDQSESDPDLYYCASCDYFVAASHFEAEHAGQSEERFLNSLRSWQRRPAHSKIRVHRPASATNVLAVAAMAQQAAREASRSGFHRWLLSHLGRNDAVGDLARDVKGDRSFPISEGSLAELRAYLQRMGAAAESIRALRDAWGEFTTSASV